MYIARRRTNGGLSYVETIVGVAIFALVSIMLYTTYSRVFVTVRAAQARVDAIALAEGQFEIIRNLPYAKVGTVSGIPNGVLHPVQYLTSGGMLFVSTTTIRNIDHPFDGTAGGSPDDLSPADNKLVEIDIACLSCATFRPMTLVTTIAPKDLEGASTNGSLFIRAIDAAGVPVPNAEVHIVNTSGSSTIDIHDVTSPLGLLQIVDAPPAANSYQIFVTKSGYSFDQTESPSGPTTTNPVKAHATVVAQTVTQATFAIDRTSTANFSSVTSACGVVPNVGVRLTGAKLIGTAPDVLKFDTSFLTDGSGLRSFSDIEWDDYTVSASSSTHDLAGIVPFSPMAIAPGATQNIQLIMSPKDRPAVLVEVKDGVTGLPVSGATVTLEQGGVSTTKITGRGFLSQTDWSGGSGQSEMIDATRYGSDDGGVNVTSSPGEVVLQQLFGAYLPTGVLTSSIFDTGSPSNFYQFTFQPSTQHPDTGDESVKFQIATSNSTSTWTYLGPDGTASTYYTATSTNFSSVNDGQRYLRYKMFLSTASSTVSPNVSDIQFTFTSSCVPPGQVLFGGLSTGTYNITVSMSGYTTVNDTVSVTSGSWTKKEETLSL